LTRTSAMIFVKDDHDKISQYTVAEGAAFRDLPPILKLFNNIVFDLDEIVPRLYLSGVVPAVSPPTLEKHRITHVVTVMQDPPDVLPTVPTSPPKRKITSSSNSLPESCSSTSPNCHSGSTRMRIPVADAPSSDLHSHFPRAVSFITSALANDPDARILCHCYGGVSRSATIVVAYLMSTQKMSVDEALKFVRGKRQQVNPNLGFMAQLRRWEKDIEQRHIRKKRTLSASGSKGPTQSRRRKG